MSDLLEEYEALSDRTAVYPAPHEMELHTETRRALYPVLGLAGEAGELLNKYKKIIRDEGGRINTGHNLEMLAELGDVFWYWYRCCKELGADPEDVIRMNMQKLDGRRERGTLHGEGDDR